jgi:hypothetical protein
VVRLPQFEVDGISLLMLHNFEAVVSYVPTAGRYARLNLALIPGLDTKIGIVRLDAQVRLAGKVVSLRPVVCLSKSGEGEYGNEQRQADFAHGGSSPGI